MRHPLTKSHNGDSLARLPHRKRTKQKPLILKGKGMFQLRATETNRLRLFLRFHYNWKLHKNLNSTIKSCELKHFERPLKCC